MMTRQAFVTEVVAYLKRGEIFFVVYAWDGEYALHKLKELAQSHRLLFKRFTSSSYSLSELKFKVAGVAVPTLCVFWDGITGVSRPERLVDSVSDLLTRIRTQQLPWAVFVIVERRGDLPDRLSGEWPISVELRESELADVQAVLSRDNKAYQAWKALSPVQQQEVHQTLRGVRFTAAVSLLARVLREAPSPSEVLSTLRRERLNKGTSTRSVTMVPVNPAEVRVGGMQGFRQWLWETKQAFTAEGRAFGLPAPRGVLLVGLPGTGKSLAAKLVAAEYGLPLLRFDVPNVYGPYVGESEANMREALSFIDKFGPAVVWVDEIEKILAFNSSQRHDQSIQSYFLQWAQERRSDIFLFATANNIANASPEFFRRGRFDEVFFVDLPTFSERKEIFEVMLRRYVLEENAERLAIYRKWGVKPPSLESYDLDRLAARSEGYTGAEIEEVVRKALLRAFSAAQPLCTYHLEQVMEELIPQAYMQAEQIGQMRELVRQGRIRSAGPFYEEPPAL